MNHAVVFGQFIPGNSMIHHLDARIKIISLIFFIISIFMVQNFWGLLLKVVAIALILFASGISVKLYIKSLKTIFFVVLLTSILNIFYGSGPILFKWQFIQITLGGILNSIFISSRIIALVLLSSVLTFTTSPTELTDAIEKLMQPLTWIHVPVHEIAMMMCIALRFIPLILEETDKISNAQKARGADLESGGPLHRVKVMIPILIPLFVSSFRRAYDLAIAMECRCYQGGEGRTKMKNSHLGSFDFLILLAGILLVSTIILLSLCLPSALIQGAFAYA